MVGVAMDEIEADLVGVNFNAVLINVMSAVFIRIQESLRT